MEKSTYSATEIVGQIALGFGNLELTVEVGIWQLVAGKDEEVRHLMEAVTAEMSFDRKVHAFGSLYKLRFPEEADDPDLREVIKLLFEAQGERNALLHSGWSYSDEEKTLTRMKASSKARKGLERNFYVMTPAILLAVQERIEEVGQQFARFAMTRIQERLVT